MIPVFALHNVTLAYQRHPAVHHVSGVVMPGSLTAITGPNGAGKSTLLRGMAGLLKPQQGTIECSVPLSDIAYLPQAVQLRREFPITALEFVLMGRWQSLGLHGGVSPSCRERALQSLAQVGLQGFDARPLSSLSAGQFQRLLFARLLAQDARTILLDEPFAAIDAPTIARLLAIILQWHAEGRTVLCVLHDYHMIESHFPECIFLARECIAWAPTHAALSSTNRHHAEHFREAWQDTAPTCTA